MLASLLREPVIWIGRTFLRLLVASGVTPNQITLTGLALVLLSCALYVLTNDMFVLGVGLSLSYAFDGLDGTIARRTGKATLFGGYLDAVVDRYQEIVSYFVVGLVKGWWIGVFLLTVGSLLVSYNKAAVALQVQIENKAWPDLMERPRRAWLFCAALILDNAVPVPDRLGGSFAHLAIWYIAILVHFTAVQRFVRAKRMLMDMAAPSR
ncbi:MAG: CDP-alcohol phosphatidyltransferase family protein [Bradyrhizobium sp.]|uniref:CDP-alcohol phosphatidyltransferase family protein n=1 Tax=Bradyrhizobium sp. TaxID=376 RepID=UPI00239AD28A|nr:CDP-alcohol phosphatidyltransferase family protein [Bradyrhizobium sp.]MDE2065758.1 CDP-alcohol phosphatidyltransferase family protein [Bradyrhizobium sp.]MDE2242263.1 CDP-alcohol phosphatidyltransferase family protein [Bradyrhizobium sp.]MDE2470519.1 CDP-alcohol phosphatidyltransferase family protein [Bradyrhizobium sp.]